MSRLLSVVWLCSAIVACVNSLPIRIKNENYPNTVIESLPEITEKKSPEMVLAPPAEENNNGTILHTSNETDSSNRALHRNIFRPGMTMNAYNIHLEPDIDAGTFSGEVVINVGLSEATLNVAVRFQIRNLDIESVTYAIGSGVNANFVDAPFSVNADNNILTIEPDPSGSTLRFRIVYSGELDPAHGFYIGSYGDGETYLAMNLNPTFARYVFPCIDEPTESSEMQLTVEGLQYQSLISNARHEEESDTRFRPISASTHRLGMMAHNFDNVNIPIANVWLYGRDVPSTHWAMSSSTISAVFTFLNQWTNKNYFEIVEDVQSANLQIIAIPDISSDWHSLSIVGIWEPYIYMQAQHSMLQRLTGMVHIAEAISRQWFGFVIWPDNWIHDWIITGLNKYAAYQALKEFQTNPTSEEDVSLLDMDTIFFTDVIRESLLQDAMIGALVMQPANRIFQEDAVRVHLNSLQKVKAAAIMNMLKNVFDGENDIIEEATKGLFSGSMEPQSFLNFLDALNGVLLGSDDIIIGNIREFLEQYASNQGYPLLTVNYFQGTFSVTPTRFGFSTRPAFAFDVPITYTTSDELDFENLAPSQIVNRNEVVEIPGFDDDDWVIFNIQGQGYYRVNYAEDLWNRLIGALQDPEERENIHPLNRATLVDDALNLARAGTVPYDLAFNVLMAAMEQETEYAVWKAFVRNMNFVRKHLMRAVENDGLNEEIYIRLIRRVIITFEEELTFEQTLNEPAMVSLTRSLVMDHVCRANYEHCVAAAVDVFYDDSEEEPTVNPQIPTDLRPAVYCTMAREGDEEALEALRNRLEVEPTMYERVVILEAMACSQDDDFIEGYLDETIAGDSPYSIEEKLKIFTAVAESSASNANHALRFLTLNVNDIRERYGGPERLETAIMVMADNVVDEAMVVAFNNWVLNIASNLDSSLGVAQRALTIIQENQAWRDEHLEEVYEWIMENNATAAVVSTLLVFLTFMLTIFNH